MVIDTNVLVNAANEDAQFHGPCRRYIDQRVLEPGPTFLTWNICYEFFRVSTHIRVFDNPFDSDEALNFIEDLLSAPSFSLLTATDRHLAVLSQTLDELPELRSNIFHDLHTAVLMREHGISQICTRDADFYRFPFLTVVDPLHV